MRLTLSVAVLLVAGAMAAVGLGVGLPADQPSAGPPLTIVIMDTGAATTAYDCPGGW